MALDHLYREPVSTYGQALSWLFRHSDVPEWAFEGQSDLPSEANLVCDMFWVTPEQLRKDLRKLWNQACAPVPVRPAAYRRKGGW